MRTCAIIHPLHLELETALDIAERHFFALVQEDPAVEDDEVALLGGRSRAFSLIKQLEPAHSLH